MMMHHDVDGDGVVADDDDVDDLDDEVDDDVDDDDDDDDAQQTSWCPALGWALS